MPDGGETTHSESDFHINSLLKYLEQIEYPP